MSRTFAGVSRLRTTYVGGVTALAVALSGAAWAGRAARAAHGERASLVAFPGAGPRAQAPPAGAIVAPDASQLARLVADREGPAIVALAPDTTYEIDLVVRRPVRIVGQVGSVLQGTGRGTVVTVESDDVTLQDFVVRRSGGRHTVEDSGVRATGRRLRLEHMKVEDCLFGVALRECKSCVVEGVHVIGRLEDPELAGDAIKIWESDHSVVRRSLVERARDIVVWYSRHVVLEDNVVTKSRYGSHFMYAHDSVVRRSRLVDNTVGIFVMYSTNVRVEDNVLAGAAGPAGVGIGFKEADDVFLQRNSIVGNTLGAYLDQSPRSPNKEVLLEGNLLALNQVGLRLHGAQQGGTFRDNDFHENAVVVEVETGDALRTTFEGNRFSDYAGYDLDGDGFGDVAYEERILSSELVVAHSDLRLLQGTAAMGAVDAVAHAFPMFAARKVLEDRRPRIRPPSPSHPR